MIEAWERDNVEVIIGDMIDSLAELERIQAIQKNEMESIMADHSYMGDILEELGERLPPGERRQYGNY